jgi:hypothetical protein
MQTNGGMRVRLAVAQTDVGEVAAGEEAVTRRRADASPYVACAESFVAEGVS